MKKYLYRNIRTGQLHNPLCFVRVERNTVYWHWTNIRIREPHNNSRYNSQRLWNKTGFSDKKVVGVIRMNLLYFIESDTKEKNIPWKYYSFWKHD